MILVTGASGFIGRNLAIHFAKQSICVKAGLRDHLPPELENVDKRFLRLVPMGDLAAPNLELWRQAVANCDTVIHCAGVSRDTEPEDRLLKVNYQASYELAELAAKAKVKRFIFLSSVKAMTESSQIGQVLRVTDEARPATSYGRSKLMAEQAISQIGQAYEMTTLILRLPMVYGAGAAGNLSLIMKWLDKALPLPLASVTDNRRSLISLDNLLAAIGVCAFHPSPATKGIWLIADRETPSTAELIQRLAKQMGINPRLWKFPPSLLSLALSLCGQRSIAHRLLGSLVVDASPFCHDFNWQPPLSLDEGLRRMVSGEDSSH